MTAEELKKSILQQAIQGKLVPQNPDDEPAATLHDRIREEKSRLFAEGIIKHDKNESRIFRNPDGQYFERNASTEKNVTDLIPFEIPENWEWCRIGNIFFHNNGKQLNKSNKSGVMMDYITTSNLYWDGFRLDNLKQMPFESTEIGRCQAVKGDLLVCEGGDIGRSCIWGYDFPIMLQNHIHKLRGIIPVETKYFYYIFLLYNLKGIIGGKGIGIQGFSAKALHNTLIPLPPHAEQKRIVEKIEELMPLVEEYGKAQSRLDELNSSLGDNLRKSVLQYAIQGKLFPQAPDDEPASVLLDRIREEKTRLAAEGKIKRDKNESAIYRNDDGRYIECIGKNETDISDQIPFEIPDSWEWTRFSFIADIARGGSPRPIKSFLTDDSNGVNWIKIGDTEKGNKYINSVKEKIKPSGVSKSRMVKKGDFLLTNSMSFGRPYITNVEGCIHDGWLVISPYFDTYNSDFLFYLLSSPFAFNQFSDKVSGAVVKNLNTVKVLNALIPLPPLAEQKRIVERIEQIFSLCK